LGFKTIFILLNYVNNSTLLTKILPAIFNVNPSISVRLN